MENHIAIELHYKRKTEIGKAFVVHFVYMLSMLIRAYILCTIALHPHY